MSGVRYREEVFNVILAQLLHEHGVASVPEQVLRSARQGRPRRMPDVLAGYLALT